MGRYPITLPVANVKMPSQCGQLKLGTPGCCSSGHQRYAAYDLCHEQKSRRIYARLLVVSSTGDSFNTAPPINFDDTRESLARHRFRFEPRRRIRHVDTCTHRIR
ncbi:hypothetical protein EVAR_54392_1 [Eumeta japonica]|uniref:Uncharacterized protein n=1 Tax=Eumeta variegata TaxID=151549 RepID=A0A4C1Y6X6_EUMVA|nr:hypothetical protein EVAR_54392_1 [Eumeta japonica]